MKKRQHSLLLGGEDRSGRFLKTGILYSIAKGSVKLREQFFNDVSRLFHEFCSLFDESMCPLMFPVFDGTRDGKHLTVLLKRKSCRDQRATFLIGFRDDHA